MRALASAPRLSIQRARLDFVMQLLRLAARSQRNFSSTSQESGSPTIFADFRPPFSWGGSWVSPERGNKSVIINPTADRVTGQTCIDLSSSHSTGRMDKAQRYGMGHFRVAAFRNPAPSHLLVRVRADFEVSSDYVQSKFADVPHKKSIVRHGYFTRAWTLMQKEQTNHGWVSFGESHQNITKILEVRGDRPGRDDSFSISRNGRNFQFSFTSTSTNTLAPGQLANVFVGLWMGLCTQVDYFNFSHRTQISARLARVTIFLTRSSDTEDSSEEMQSERSPEDTLVFDSFPGSSDQSPFGHGH